MNTRTYWKLFFKAQRRDIVFSALVIACFALTLALYQLPLQVILYPSFLCACLTIAYLLYAYLNYRKKYNQLQQLRAHFATDSALAVPPATLEDCIYQELLQELSDQTQKATYNQTQAKTAMTHYYTMWVHQIKTPISALHLLLEHTDTAETRACKQEVLRIEQYVEMVLAYLRLNTTSTDYVLKSCDLDTLIRKALRRFSTIFIEKKVQLHYDPTATTIITDEKWLLFVIEQLLSNALKYTPAGGTITISCTDGQHFILQDSGIGIAPEDLPRVFENGYTGNIGRTEKSSSGIGLYLCHTICTRLNHPLAITSTQGKGTTVSIDLQQYPKIYE